MDNLRRILILIVFIILFSQISLAIKVSPPIDAGMLEPMRDYEFYISLTNQENKLINVTLDFTPRAEYLFNYTTFSPNNFNLTPYETKKVLITIHTPVQDEIPGNHILTILPEVSTTSGSGIRIMDTSVAEIKFTLPGNITKKLVLENFELTQREDNINFQLFTKNTGNVRVGAFPFVEIQKYYGLSSVYHSTVKGTTQYLISLGESPQMNIIYNTASLEAGRYKAIAKVKYDDNKTNIISEEFEIKKSEEGEQEEIEGSVSVGEKENDPINIGGEITDEAQGTQYGAEKPELRISRLNVEQAESGDLLISLGIENIHKDNISYEIIFNIFDESGNKVDEMKDSGEIEGFGIKEIKKHWYNGKPEKYKVRVELKYGDKTVPKESWAKPLQKKLSKKPEKVPTGFLIFNSILENIGIILIIITVGLIFIYLKIYKQPKRK